jgi:hypothetical protein
MNALMVVLMTSVFELAFACETSAIATPGAFPSPGGGCIALLTGDAQKKGMALTVGKDSTHQYEVARDVSSMVWLSDQALGFASSRSSGKSGLYYLACDERGPQVTSLVAADHPGAAEYFELRSFDDGFLSYYHVPGSEQAAPGPLRSASNLQHFNLYDFDNGRFRPH